MKESVHEKWELLKALKERLELIEGRVKRGLGSEDGEEERDAVKWLKRNMKITGSSLMRYEWSL